MPDDGEPDLGQLAERWADAPRDPVILRGGSYDTLELQDKIAIHDPENADCWLLGHPIDLPRYV
jgi:hypothetical protein